MATTVSVEGITAQQLGESIGQWVQRATIEAAMTALRTEVSRGFDHEPVVVTDGVVRRDPNQVKPFGKIEFVARTSTADAVLWALQRLREISPVLTGRYRDSHIVMVNGEQITGDTRAALLRVKPGDRVQIVNFQPYARKIEGATASKRTGRQRRKALSRQARSGVYRAVMRELVQRFGRTLLFDQKMVKLNTGVKVWGKQGGKSGRRVLRDQVFPAIQLFVKQDLPS